MADKTSEIKDIPCETFPLFLRNNYFYGKLLTVSSFQMEQQYFINKHRLGNLLIHGSGVVCGLQVSKSGNHEITISSGVALDQCGREIILSDTHILDLNKELSSPISPAKIYLKSAVEGRDLTTKILKSATYSDESCYSTIEEKYQIEIESSTKQSTQFAETLQSKGIALSTPKEEKTTASPIDNVALLLTQPTITSKDSLSFAIEKKKEGFYVRSCPVSSEERVLLAQVFFNVDEKGSIAIEHIATNRPVVYTNETLFRLIKELEREINPIEAYLPSISGVSWVHDKTFLSNQEWIDNCSKGFKITFSKPMKSSTINRDTLNLALEITDFDLGTIEAVTQSFPFIRIQIRRVAIPIEFKSNDGRVVEFVISQSSLEPMDYFSIGGLDKLLSGSIDRPLTGIRGFKLKLIVQLRGDFVCSDEKESKCLDGDFLKGIFPTGNGIEGGLFESWFSLKALPKPPAIEIFRPVIANALVDPQLVQNLMTKLKPKGTPTVSDLANSSSKDLAKKLNVTDTNIIRSLSEVIIKAKEFEANYVNIKDVISKY